MTLTFHYVSVLTCTKLRVKEKKSFPLLTLALFTSFGVPTFIHVRFCKVDHFYFWWEVCWHEPFFGYCKSLFHIMGLNSRLAEVYIPEKEDISSSFKKFKGSQVCLLMYYYQCLLFIDSLILSFPTPSLAWARQAVLHSKQHMYAII
jgi:hypothetical protein